MKQFLFLLISFCSYGQQIHHQMVSAQGSVNLLVNGGLVKQTVGQQSVVGNYNYPKVLLGQGFQQSSLSSTRLMINNHNVITQVYPNPFVNQIQFQFSEPVLGNISIRIFDLLGRLVYSDSKLAVKAILTLENLQFSENVYVVKLSISNYNFTTQIIKSK